jgi:hypothetical protein
MLLTKHCRQRPAKPTAQGSTAGRCVSATVLNHFLYIHNIQLFFSSEVVVGLWIFVVERLDWYEWNCGQEW